MRRGPWAIERPRCGGVWRPSTSRWTPTRACGACPGGAAPSSLSGHDPGGAAWAGVVQPGSQGPPVGPRGASRAVGAAWTAGGGPGVGSTGCARGLGGPWGAQAGAPAQAASSRTWRPRSAARGRTRRLPAWAGTVAAHLGSGAAALSWRTGPSARVRTRWWLRAPRTRDGARDRQAASPRPPGAPWTPRSVCQPCAATRGPRRGRAAGPARQRPDRGCRGPGRRGGKAPRRPRPSASASHAGMPGRRGAPSAGSGAPRPARSARRCPVERTPGSCPASAARRPRRSRRCWWRRASPRRAAGAYRSPGRAARPPPTRVGCPHGGADPAAPEDRAGSDPRGRGQERRPAHRGDRAAAARATPRAVRPGRRGRGRLRSPHGARDAGPWRRTIAALATRPAPPGAGAGCHAQGAARAVRGVEPRVVGGARCPREACLSRRVPPASRPCGPGMPPRGPRRVVGEAAVAAGGAPPPARGPGPRGGGRRHAGPPRPGAGPLTPRRAAARTGEAVPAAVVARGPPERARPARDGRSAGERGRARARGDGACGRRRPQASSVERHAGAASTPPRRRRTLRRGGSPAVCSPGRAPHAPGGPVAVAGRCAPL